MKDVYEQLLANSKKGRLKLVSDVLTNYGSPRSI